MKKNLTIVTIFLFILCVASCGSAVFAKGGAKKLRTCDVNTNPWTGYFYRGSTNGYWQGLYFGKKTELDLKLTSYNVADDALCFRIYGGHDLDYFYGYGTVSITNNTTCVLELLGGKQGDEDTLDTTGIKLKPTTLTLDVFKDGEILKLSGPLSTESNDNYRTFKNDTFLVREN